MSSGNIILGSGLPEVMPNSPGRDWALALQVQDTSLSMIEITHYPLAHHSIYIVRNVVMEPYHRQL